MHAEVGLPFCPSFFLWPNPPSTLFLFPLTSISSPPPLTHRRRKSVACKREHVCARSGKQERLVERDLAEDQKDAALDSVELPFGLAGLPACGTGHVCQGLLSLQDHIHLLCVTGGPAATAVLDRAPPASFSPAA